MIVVREKISPAVFSLFFHSIGQEGVRNAERKDLNKRSTKLGHNGKVGAED